MSKKPMQAILVHEYGGPNVLKEETVERPQPQTDEVLVRIVYATVIPLDYKIRNGWVQEVFPVTFPYIPGFYASGVVEEVGQTRKSMALQQNSTPNSQPTRTCRP